MNPTRGIRATITLTVALTLTGCVYLGGPVPHPGVNTPFDGLSTKTKPQLLDETLEKAQAVAQLIGGEWLDSGTPPVVFDPANQEQRDAWDWGPCDNEATTGQYDVAVWQDADPSARFDPDALTEMVRSYWEGLGYTIRQIGPPALDETRGRSINVDLPHGAGLHFAASTKILGIAVHSECVTWE
ncbi:hypothetical protein [Leifsonia sp. CL147]|uniref:hypothetical protein n=2 Tax=unclassified Leifsonia TaxID=2663824 RepID=UPI0008F37DA1|nr:hypothetical protein [Leifsonia sp. CL147]SFL33524.1 hypothetical protein SAMN04515692_10318 [Leifsonia sp. CL147]